jgi:hypothetical protein
MVCLLLSFGQDLIKVRVRLYRKTKCQAQFAFLNLV